ncbi:transposase, Ptta/En/Spm, plant [Spatholobus suberectus]|nr:transposase, Ptta/En/Spm, plant [Spatholobus suberectus]
MAAIVGVRWAQNVLIDFLETRKIDKSQDAYGWTIRIEKYFQIEGVDEKARMQVVTLAVEGLYFSSHKLVHLEGKNRKRKGEDLVILCENWGLLAREMQTPNLCKLGSVEGTIPFLFLTRYQFETKEEALKHVPDDINESDWQFLVDYFSSPSFEIMSAKNKANKAKRRTNHTTGSKSFLAVSYDADKVAEHINEKRCQVEDSQEVVETIEQEIINTAFKTVVGKKSYMQGFGAGLRSSSSSSSTIQQL